VCQNLRKHWNIKPCVGNDGEEGGRVKLPSLTQNFIWNVSSIHVAASLSLSVGFLAIDSSYANFLQSTCSVSGLAVFNSFSFNANVPDWLHSSKALKMGIHKTLTRTGLN